MHMVLCSPSTMALEAIKYNGQTLEILNQLLLPSQSIYEEVKDVQDAWEAIRSMKVRGAPAIAIVGTLSVALKLKRYLTEDDLQSESLLDVVKSNFEYLKTARPTAVNIAESAERFIRRASQICVSQSEKETKALWDVLVKEMESMLPDDIAANKAIGKHGAKHILDHSDTNKVTVLTHCNTGSLATAGYGTALGVVRALSEEGRLEHVYCTETRPYNQGARLTAYEIVHDNLPGTLICDSMGALLMKQWRVSAVVVGADRVVSNGDTANKIGTYQLAVAAKFHSIPFYIASPVKTIDFSLQSGDQITIEERPAGEMVCVNGHRVAAEGISVWNPAFDVTPASLITGGIVTERGVFPANSLGSLRL